MAEDKKNLDVATRRSVMFLVDYENYNAGDSAVFNAGVAAGLVRRGAVKYNEHEVRNDTNLMGLLEGTNQRAGKSAGGMSEKELEAKISKLLDEKFDKFLASLENKKPMDNAVKK